MRKAVLTVGLALSAASGLASAQGSVTLYGVIDGGFLYASKTANGSDPNSGLGKQYSMITGGKNPSVFGFTGSEDLGGGTKAEFKLESGFSTVNGGFADCNGNFFGCQAWVAIDNSRWGVVKTGLQFSPFFLSVYETDARAFSLFGSGVVNYVDQVLGTGIYTANSISYSSPSIAGFEGSALFAFGGDPTSFKSGRQYSASIKYSNGGFLFNAAFFDGKAGGTANTPVSTNVEFVGKTIGAKYRFGDFTVSASVVNYNVANSFDAYVFGGGVNYLVTPAVNLSAGAWLTRDRNDSNNRSILGSVGVDYFLSKRTLLYAQFAAVNNHGTMNTGASVNGALYGTTGTTFASVIGIKQNF